MKEQQKEHQKEHYVWINRAFLYRWIVSRDQVRDQVDEHQIG